MSKRTKKGDFFRYPRGFTLIELLVVISIIGTLAGMILVSMGDARAKARDGRRKQDIMQFRKALELYYNENGRYPASGGATSPNGGWSTSNDASWNTLTTAMASFIRLPKDPINTVAGWSGGGSYAYSFYSLNYGCAYQWYMIVYKLEKPDITSPGVRACNGTNFNYANTITIGMCQGCQ